MNDKEAQALIDKCETLKIDLEDARAQLAKLPPAEAGFSTNYHLVHDRAGSQQFTFRGALSSDWPQVMSDAAAFTKHMAEQGWRFNVPQAAPPPAPNHAAEIVRADNPEMAAHLEATAAEVPAPPEGKQWQTIDAKRIVIQPEPDERVTISFFAEGHKWPDIKANKWKAAQAAGLLKHVTSAAVDKAADLALACRVYYTNGKEKSDKPGEFWKDIAHVRPL